MNRSTGEWPYQLTDAPTTVSVPLPDPTIHGVRLTCKDLSFSYPDSTPVFENFNLEITPGEKIAIFSETITEYRDQHGELVVTARGVGVRMERPVEQS